MVKELNLKLPGTKVFTSFWSNPPIPVFKLRLKNHFPEPLNDQPQAQICRRSLSLSTHPDKNQFLVSDGFQVVLVEFPSGFDDCSTYAEVLMIRSEILLKKLKRKEAADVKVTSAILPPPPMPMTTATGRGNNFARSSMLRKIFRSLKKTSAEANPVAVGDYQVTFEEILRPFGGQIEAEDPSHVFLRGLESLRELVFFVFTLSGQTWTRKSFQKLLKLVSNRFVKMMLRCPKSVASVDRTMLSTNWIVDVVKLSDFDVDNVFTNSLVFLVNSTVKTLVKLLPAPGATER